jgi:hypothetical protein
LVPNLRDNERYVIHYKNFKLYHSLGLKVTKIHRAVKFRQEAWMAPYIQLNTSLTAKASSEFKNDFFKLMDNSVFGKTIVNLCKRIWVDLVRGEENDKMRRLVAKPAYIYTQNLQRGSDDNTQRQEQAEAESADKCRAGSSRHIQVPEVRLLVQPPETPIR